MAKETDWARIAQRLTQLWKSGPQISLQQLAPINSSVLIVTGEDDSIRFDHLEQMHSAIPGSRLVVIPGAKHSSLMTHPIELNSVLLDFLTGREDAEPRVNAGGG